MKVSIIIPCYNEVHTIHRIICEVNKSGLENMEIIIADDCSNDGTIEYLQSVDMNKFSISKIIFQKKNLGKGAAIRACLKHVTGEVVIIQDADLEYSPQEYSILLHPIVYLGADVVYGSRFLGGDNRRVLYFWHSMGNKFLTLLSNIFTNLTLTDMETCYKVFKSSLLKNIVFTENRFGFEPEFTAKIARLGCVIYEVGISYHGRTYSEGKKINWKDGFSAIYCIFKYNLFSRT
jgi:glycosyltransferase involved in cell wall biosynthesis